MEPFTIFAAFEGVRQAGPAGFIQFGLAITVAVVLGAWLAYSRRSPPRYGNQSTEIRVWNGRIFEAILRNEAPDPKPKPKSKRRRKPKTKAEPQGDEPPQTP